MFSYVSIIFNDKTSSLIKDLEFLGAFRSIVFETIKQIKVVNRKTKNYWSTFYEKILFQAFSFQNAV